MFRFSDFIILELTYKCNLQCSYCYLDYSNLNPVGEMSLETFKSFVDKTIVQRKINGRKDIELQIILHGGEPTLLDPEKLDTMISYAIEKFEDHGVKYFFNMQTNGTTINEDHLKYLKKVNSVGISLDGLEEAFSLRSDNTKMVENIRSTMSILDKNNIRYGVLSVITNRSIDRIEELRNVIDKSLKIFPVYDVQNKNSHIEVPQKEYFEKIIKKDLDNKFYANCDGTELNNQLTRQFKRVFADILFNHTDTTQSTCNFKFCGSGLRIVSVQPDGSIHRCDRWSINKVDKEEYELSDLKYYDFLGIYQLKEAVKFNYMLHNIHKETGCDECFARYACDWDCQSLHYSKYGEYGVDKEKVCTITKELYKYVEYNIIDILKELAKNKITMKFEEDKIHSERLRKSILMQQNGIKTYIDEDNKPSSTVKFMFEGDE